MLLTDKGAIGLQHLETGGLLLHLSMVLFTHPTQTKFVKRFISEVIRNKRKITFSICVGPPRELSTSLFQMRFDY